MPSAGLQLRLSGRGFADSRSHAYLCTLGDVIICPQTWLLFHVPETSTSCQIALKDSVYHCLQALTILHDGY